MLEFVIVDIPKCFRHLFRKWENFAIAKLNTFFIMLVRVSTLFAGYSFNK